MKFINIEYDGTSDEVMRLLSDNDRVNEGIRFDDSREKPLIRIKKRSDVKFKMTCELVGGPTKDNGFLVGTYFSGKLIENEGRTRLKGVITTAPIYHAFLLALIAVFIFQCIRLGGFSVIPLMIAAFDILMFWKEFKKQGYIERYLKRAARRMRKGTAQHGAT